MDKPPYLQIVGPNHEPDPQADEFVPLPHYPWHERPATLQLDHDECATALHLSGGNLPAAAELLKIPLYRLSRSVRASPGLQRIRDESLSLGLEKATAHVLESLDATTLEGDPDIKRRDWATSKLLSSKIAQNHPLSPASQTTNTSATLTTNSGGTQKSVTFRWRTDADAVGLTDESENDIDG